MLIDNFEKFKEVYGYGRYFLHFVVMEYALRIVGAASLIFGFSLGGWGLVAVLSWAISVILYFRIAVLRGKVTAYIDDGELIERTMKKIYRLSNASIICLTLSVLFIIMQVLI